VKVLTAPSNQAATTRANFLSPDGSAVDILDHGGTCPIIWPTNFHKTQTMHREAFTEFVLVDTLDFEM
jgi:hypothetical protein